MQLTSPVFEHESAIPKKHTCEAEEVSPPLRISDVPENTQSLALIVHDPDVPKKLQEEKGAPAEWTHWVLFNIPPTATEIAEGGLPEGVMQGNNGGGNPGWQGPCPPKEFDPPKHRYVFRLYALDTTLDLPEGVSREDVEKAMEGHILEQTELLGFYEKE